VQAPARQQRLLSVNLMVGAAFQPRIVITLVVQIAAGKPLPQSINAYLKAVELFEQLHEAISKMSFGPNSLLGARFKSSKYMSIPPV
jgi:hypothetical protein